MTITTPPTPFPLYLLPSLPFIHRRRRSSTSTNGTVPSPSSSPNTRSNPVCSATPANPATYLNNSPTSQLRCTNCLTDLLPTTSIISKGFTGRHGRAYLVSAPPASSLSSSCRDLPPGDIPNTLTHKPVPRLLVTGKHTVSDISCRTCGSVLGWKYVEAEEETQKYKVGKFILETKRVVRGVEWEVDADSVAPGGRVSEEAEDVHGDERIEFDSEDEDECEDLFAGIWTPALAKRRRRHRRFGAFESDV